MVKKRRQKIMPRRSSSRHHIIIKPDGEDEEDVPFPKFLTGMPPWYIRAFLYGMMLLCFSMVFFMESPETRHQREQNEKIKAVNPNANSDKEKSLQFDQSIIDQECRRTNTQPQFLFCGSLQLVEIDQDHDYRLLMKNIKEMEKNSQLGLIDIGLSDGGYLATYAATRGHKIFVRANGQGQLRKMKIGAQANNIIDKVKIFSGDQKTADQNGNTKSIDLDSMVDQMNFKEAVMRIDLGDKECNAFEKSNTFLSSVNVRRIFMPWRPYKEEEGDCKNLMITKLTSMQYKPKTLQEDDLDVNNWKDWPNGYVIWKKITFE